MYAQTIYRYLKLLPFLMLWSFSQAQEQVALKEPYNFSLKYHYGFVMNHSENMAHLANQHPWGLEADVSRKTVGKKHWQAIHNYPTIGYSFQYFRMDPNKPLGDSYSLIIYYSQPIVKSKRFSMNYRLGFGGGYIERRFNIHTNYKNNLNSTRFNFALNGRISFNYSISDRLNLNAGFGIMHYSNGSLKVPNLGINLPSVHFGIGWTPWKVSVPNPVKDTSHSYSKKLEINLSLSGGLKQVEPIGGKSWFASTTSIYVGKQVSRRSILNFGTDWFYDGSNKLTIDTLSRKSKIKYYKWGLVAGTEYLVGKLSLLVQLGYYLYDPLKLEKPVYQRVGLKYHFTDRYFANVNLKTHFGQADYVEWGIGIKLRK